ncbi:protein tyrosine phosphatase [Crenobacter luteus]|uniref:low molecular weight protein-tyrosine-phosphatase n=1 Tax=Crenobacter luteus TaxID=1452487 RepID=UPI001051B1F9|nr:low molecular weight protein-tyrosine-phosphatase [Crenobacter luteus]TCP15739.1 protein tyrosine phosphatase [Crenobacter luteus]
MHILFVCMGNICRSPTAEGVMRARLEAAGLDGWRVDSAGTHGYHVGEAPDPRTCAAAARRGYALDGLRARRVEADDFERFDLILAADRRNLAELTARCPAEHRHKLALLLDVLDGGVDEVPDPYYGGAQGFDTVLDLVEAACDGWLARLRQG